MAMSAPSPAVATSASVNWRAVWRLNLAAAISPWRKLPRARCARKLAPAMWICEEYADHWKQRPAAVPSVRREIPKAPGVCIQVLVQSIYASLLRLHTIFMRILGQEEFL